MVPVEGTSGAEADHRGRKIKDLGSAQLCLLEKDPLAFGWETRRLGGLGNETKSLTLLIPVLEGQVSAAFGSDTGYSLRLNPATR